ncbi:hypothetical protein [Methyloraptor flagellatus]|uniref:Transmembrane protein n=1 Tax=Methyloraptor flagellatus TaxID=3162530 RepID=A0AAU7X9D4_9HYPH
MFFNIPLTLVPLVVYNLVGLGPFGVATGDPWTRPILALDLVSGGRFTLMLGDVLIVVALVSLFIEIVKATRTSGPTIVDHGMSLVLFIAYLVEFLTVRACATSVFFVLMVIALIDVVGGFTVTIRGARRDFGFDRD